MYYVEVQRIDAYSAIKFFLMHLKMKAYQDQAVTTNYVTLHKGFKNISCLNTVIVDTDKKIHIGGMFFLLRSCMKGTSDC